MSEQKLGYGRFDAYTPAAKNPNRPGGPGEFIAVTRGELASLKETLTASEARAQSYKLALEKAQYEFAYGLYEEAKKTVSAALGDVTATKGEGK